MQTMPGCLMSRNVLVFVAAGTTKVFVGKVVEEGTLSEAGSSQLLNTVKCVGVDFQYSYRRS